MPRLEERDYTYFATVRGMCRTCRQIVPARVFFREDQVWQQSLCPRCENTPALIAGKQQWYLENVVHPCLDRAPLKNARQSRRGCPHDCGPCTWHASPCQLPVFSITNACDLDCPICFTYNRQDRVYHMSSEELRRTLDWIIESSGPVDLINLTGGEPTQHPQLLDLLAKCRRPEIGRITMNTNGLRLARDQDLCQRLAELGIYVILSLNTFDPATSVQLHGRDIVGEKLRAIEHLTKAGAKITLLNVLVRGVNEDALARLLTLLRTNDSVLSLTVQTMTYTGHGGGGFQRRTHIPVDEAARILCDHSGGTLKFSDFGARPAAHPLCYLTAYLLKTDATLLPFARFAEPEQIAALMQDSYLLRLDKDERFFHEAINRLYSRSDASGLEVFRALVKQLYPAGQAPTVFERQRLAESAVRTIYIHSHMDEDNFDCARAMLCPDLVPSQPGRLVPACTYNLFYRMQDERFFGKRG